jgi:FtsZ-binding cell division protein ZapB
MSKFINEIIREKDAEIELLKERNRSLQQDRTRLVGEIERLRGALGHLDAAAHVSRENQGGWLGAPFVEQIVHAALKEDKG